MTDSRARVEQARKQWANFVWPDWVPRDLALMIASDYACRFEGPDRYTGHSNVPYSLGQRVAIANGDFGWVVDLEDPSAKIIGRFVHCWGNVARIVCHDGEVFNAAF